METGNKGFTHEENDQRVTRPVAREVDLPEDFPVEQSVLERAREFFASFRKLVRLEKVGTIGLAKADEQATECVKNHQQEGAMLEEGVQRAPDELEKIDQQVEHDDRDGQVEHQNGSVEVLEHVVQAGN